MKQVLDVQGMTCGHCEKSVTTAIKLLDPKAEVTIDRSQNRVEVNTTQTRELGVVGSAFPEVDEPAHDLEIAALVVAAAIDAIE